MELLARHLCAEDLQTICRVHGLFMGPCAAWTRLLGVGLQHPARKRLGYKTPEEGYAQS